MRTECIAAVAQAIGRAPTSVEIKGIEDRILRNMRQLARKSEEWPILPHAERLQRAAQAASDELTSEAKKKQQRAAQQVLTVDRTLRRMKELRAQTTSDAAAVVAQLEQVDVYVKGVGREYFSALMDTLAAAEPRFLGLVDNDVAMRDFVREVFGEKTGNEIAAKGARAWLTTIDAMRERFNRAGGEIRKLDYGYLPQPTNQRAVLKAGVDGWVNKTRPLLDRSRYVGEDGARFSDAELDDFLRAAYETLSTGGLNKLVPGQFAGGGMRANRGNESRQIHFKDAQSYITYMGEFGRGTVFEAMQGHVYGLSKDIGLVESFGPNAAGTFKLLNDTALKADGREKHVGPLFIRAKDAWNALSGFSGQTVNTRLGDMAQGVRNYTVAAKLQGTLLSSLTDIPTVFVTARYNNLPVLETFANVMRSFGKETRHYANQVGLASDSIISDMSRWAEGNMAQGWTKKLANTTMKVSLLDAWTDALRRGFSVTLMSSLGKLSRTPWDQLSAADRARMSDKGITAQDWLIWQAAEPEFWRGSAMLTPESIRAIADLDIRSKDQASAKLLGFIADEAEYAVLGPDLSTRAAVTRSTQKGTVEGEFLRSLLLFKSFPLAMISRHTRRIQRMSAAEAGPSAVGYAASLAVGLTLFGALSLQAKDLINGKDPRDMTKAKFWGAALAQGGGLGIYGDILYTSMGGQNRGGMSNWTALGGPIFGTAFDAADVTLGNLGQALRGEQTHMGAELVRFSRQNLPAVNLWYARAALDHLFFHELMEGLSPGYLSKVRARSQREWGQKYWWEPQDALPDRAPDFGAAGGG